MIFSEGQDFVPPNVQELLIWIKSEIKFQQGLTSAFTKQSKSFQGIAFT